MAVKGRPAIEIDTKEVTKLAYMQCTIPEMAAWFGVSVPTMERRVAKKDLHAIVEQGRCQGRMSVRRKQFQLLDEGNVTMAIWLGKQMLGQRDSFSHRFVDGADRDRGLFEVSQLDALIRAADERDKAESA